MKTVISKIAEYPVAISQLSVAIELLKLYSPRSKEILTAKWENYHPGMFLVLNGAKSSSNVIVRDREILRQIDKLPRIDATFIFPSISYSILYHHCKQNYSHLFRKFKKRKNHKVTHGWRYEAVSKLDNAKIIRDILHHRSTKSGKYYKSTQGVHRET